MSNQIVINNLNLTINGNVTINQAAPDKPVCFICRRSGGNDLYRHPSGVDVHRHCVEIQEKKLQQLPPAELYTALMILSQRERLTR